MTEKDKLIQELRIELDKLQYELEQSKEREKSCKEAFDFLLTYITLILEKIYGIK